MTDEPAFSFGEDPDNPGWFNWHLKDTTRYNAFLGKLLVRREGEIARVRMVPSRVHSNLQDSIHGGTTMGFADVALFAAARMFGMIEAGSAVTLDMSFQFIGTGSVDMALDAKVEILRETGRLIFMRGLIVQDEARIAAFSGTVRKGVGKGIVAG